MTVVCLGYRKGFADAARLKGLPVHFVTEKHKPGLRNHSSTRVRDLSDAQEVLRAVLAGVGDGISAVVTGHEQALFPATVLRSVFGLPGDTDLRTCLRFRDKQLQKSALPSTVARARCSYLPHPVPPFAELAQRLGPRIVVKPADGHGSQRTRLVTCQSELDAYVDLLPGRSDVQTVAESFTEGFEIHVDGVWKDGRAPWLAVSKYLGPLMGWAGGDAVGDVPLGREEHALGERAGRFAMEVLEALGAPDAVFHLEAFVRPDGELALGEVAARMAGAMTPEILRLTHGVDLYEAALDLALGAEPELPPQGAGPERIHGFVYLTRTVERPLTEEDFSSRFHLEDVDYPPEADGRTGSYGRWGHAVVGGPTHEDVVRTLRGIADFNRGV